MNYLFIFFSMTSCNRCINFMFILGLWVDELPDEIVRQHYNFCDLLRNPIIMLDTKLILFNMNSIHDKFATNTHFIPKLIIDYDDLFAPILVENRNIRIHMLPCDRVNSQNRSQSIYISKVIQYKSLIMLANSGPYSDIRRLEILGFIIEFVNIDLIYTNNWEFFMQVFAHLIKNSK